MPKLKPCIWNDVEYPSITAAAKANGIPLETLRTWIKLGYQCDADIKLKQSIVYKGIEYPNIAAAATVLGITRQAVRSRIATGAPKVEARERREEFIAVWNVSEGVAQVAAHFEITITQANDKAASLRKSGVQLKKMTPGRKPRKA